MSVTIGINPIGWSNDDMHTLGGDIPLETCLAQAKAAGFAGIELGHKFPRTSDRLRPVLQNHGLALVGGWYSLGLLQRTAAQEFAAASGHISLIKDLGAKIFIMAETTNAVHGAPGLPLAQTPVLDPGDWAPFGRRMGEFCVMLRDQGLAPAYHHHMGTVVETRDEIDRFMAVSGPEVGLLLDTGHATFAGVDPARLARDYGAQITHVHCKDIRENVRAALAPDASFLDGVIEGVFTVPGDGDVDFTGALSEIAKTPYEGWLVVEAEQDPKKADPEQYANLGFTNLHSLAAQAGLL
ncbi:MAG: myo-inosose-2 dehydratase [Alphaproteobacteria bacterium]